MSTTHSTFEQRLCSHRAEYSVYIRRQDGKLVQRITAPICLNKLSTAKACPLSQ